MESLKNFSSNDLDIDIWEDGDVTIDGLDYLLIKRETMQLIAEYYIELFANKIPDDGYFVFDGEEE